MTRRDILAALALPPPPAVSTVPGAVAFHYAAVFPAQALDWYARFKLLVVGGVLASDQTRRLREAGAAKLVAYEWSSAFYAGDPASSPLDWQSRARANKWLLNTEPVTGGAAENGKGAYWYDYGNPELRRARAAYLAGRVIDAGYDGLFFDTLGASQLPPPISRAFKTRYPRATYNQAQSAFFAELRRLLPAHIVFLNQGYRDPDLFLPYADYDLTESYFTALDGANATRFREWHNEDAPWESIKTPLEQLILKPAQKYPKVRFVHLNYAAGDVETVRRAALYSYACAKLFGHDSYLMCFQDHGWEQARVYFTDLGLPADPAWREDGPRVSRRYGRARVAIENGRGLILPA